MEIKPCPFCGNAPSMHPLTQQVRCRVALCAGSGMWYVLDLWNMRPANTLVTESFEQFSASLNQERTKRIKAETASCLLEDFIQPVIDFLEKSGYAVAAQMLVAK